MSIALVAGAVFFIIGRLSPIGESEADGVVARTAHPFEAQNHKKFKKRKMQSVSAPLSKASVFFPATTS